MANPNIAALSNIYGNTATVGPIGTSGNVILSNASSSATVYKVENIVITNVSGGAATINVAYNNGAAGSGASNTYLAYQISIPTAASLIVTDKTTGFYLTENTSIIVQSSTANTLHAVVSYEQIS